MPARDYLPYLLAACIALGLAAVVGIGYMLRFARELRAGLADEVRRELAASAEAQRIEIQQPLQVQAALEFATREEHRALAAELLIHALGERGSRKRIHEEITALQGDMRGLQATNEAQSASLDELKSDTKATASKVDEMAGMTKQLNTQVQQLVLGLQSRK